MIWHRVSRASRCKICDHPNWCTWSEAGNCCMRIESVRPLKNGGWLHSFGDNPRPVRKPEPIAPTIDAEAIMVAWRKNTSEIQLRMLADTLGVSILALSALRCAWAPEHNAWAFPMSDGHGMTCGIRLRSLYGNKWSVRGGREGIFRPFIEVQKTVFVCEGPTDLAALLTLGFFGLGRPSCSGGVSQLGAVIARLGILRAVIVADNDADKFRPDGKCYNPGFDGALRLENDIGVPCCLLVPPGKDIRLCLSFGITKEVIESMINNLVWHQPQKPNGREEPATWE